MSMKLVKLLESGQAFSRHISGLLAPSDKATCADCGQKMAKGSRIIKVDLNNRSAPSMHMECVAKWPNTRICEEYVTPTSTATDWITGEQIAAGTKSFRFRFIVGIRDPIATAESVASLASAVASDPDSFLPIRRFPEQVESKGVVWEVFGSVLPGRRYRCDLSDGGDPQLVIHVTDQTAPSLRKVLAAFDDAGGVREPAQGWNGRRMYDNPLWYSYTLPSGAWNEILDKIDPHT